MIRATVMVTRLDDPITTSPGRRFLLAPRNKGLSERTHEERARVAATLPRTFLCLPPLSCMRGSYSPGGKPYRIPIGSCMPYGCWFIVK